LSGYDFQTGDDKGDLSAPRMAAIEK